MARILLTDHNFESTHVFAEVFQEQGHEIFRARGADDCLSILRTRAIDVVVLDMDLPITDGFSVLKQIQEAGMEVTVVSIVGTGEYGKGKRAVHEGAFHFIARPVAVTNLLNLVEKADIVRRAAHRLAYLGITFFRDYHREKDLFKSLSICSSTDSHLLILSPKGGGGRELANLIHLSGIRKDRPILNLDCCLNPVMFERELYGYVKGAFLGASEERAGLVEKARGGVIVLENIHRLGKAAFTRLSELLSQGKYGRTGSADRRSADVRIIALSHPGFSVRRGDFPVDLYRLISNIRFEIPLLKECMSSSPEDAGKLFGSLSGKIIVPDLAIEELDLLSAHEWPGNFRELELLAELRDLVSELRMGTIVLHESVSDIPIQSNLVSGESALLMTPEKVEISKQAEPEEPEEPEEQEQEREEIKEQSEISEQQIMEDRDLASDSSYSASEILTRLASQGSSGFADDRAWMVFDAEMDYSAAKDLFEKTFIDYKLRQYNGNVTVTARELGLGRRTLQEKMKKCGIESQDYREEN